MKLCEKALQAKAPAKAAAPAKTETKPAAAPAEVCFSSPRFMLSNSNEDPHPSLHLCEAVQFFKQ